MAAKSVYLKDLHRMMDGMSIGLAEKVHLLFMNNYINSSNYGFRDEWQVDDYMSEMLCGAKEQYYDYSVLEECPMWKEAVNAARGRLFCDIDEVQ